MYSIINGQDFIIKILILILHEKENLSTYHICISFWVFKNSFGTSLTTISIHFYFPFLFLVTLSPLNHLSISSIFVVHFFTHAFQSIFFFMLFNFFYNQSRLSARRHIAHEFTGFKIKLW